MMRLTADSSRWQTSLIPWATLLVARPWEVPTKSLFFWGAYVFGVIYSGRANWLDAAIVWALLELFVNQAKYVLNDIYDMGQDSRCCDVRDSRFKDLKPNTRRVFAAAAILKACIGTFLAYWWTGKDVPLAIALFLLVPIQMLYNRSRSRFPDVAEKWLDAFRKCNKQFLSSTGDRTIAVESISLGFDTIQAIPGTLKWSVRTVGLGLLLGVGYGIRLAIPLHMLGFSANPLLFAGYLAWGTAFGFAFILGYWSWEGAWYAQRPRSFNIDDDDVAKRTYVADAARSKAHTLWCYRGLEECVGKRPRARRSLTIWEIAWSGVLLLGPVLGVFTLRHFVNWKVSWVWPVAGGVLSITAYILPSVRQLNGLKIVFGSLLLLYFGVAAAGYGPRTLPLPFVFLPSVFALFFASHYTAGPWRAFDQRYVTAELHDRVTAGRRRLLTALGSSI